MRKPKRVCQTFLRVWARQNSTGPCFPINRILIERMRIEGGARNTGGSRAPVKVVPGCAASTNSTQKQIKRIPSNLLRECLPDDFVSADRISKRGGILSSPFYLRWQSFKLSQ